MNASLNRWFVCCCLSAITATVPAADTPPVQKPALGPLEPVEVNGMTFANYWMPSHLANKSMLLMNLQFYSQAVVGDAPPHQEPVPTKLVGPFNWLMPQEEAVKAMPPGFSRNAESKIAWDCFPQNSLMVASYHCGGQSFIDRDQKFDWIYLIADRKKQLVGVQLVGTLSKRIMWEEHEIGSGKEKAVFGPYYDLINMKNIGSTARSVEYQVCDVGTGVKLVHTSPLGSHAPCNVHWYLAAPLARVFLDIANFQINNVKPK